MPPLFFPPEPNQMVIRVTHLLGGLLARLVYQLRIEVSQQDLQRLGALSQQRVIYLVNHPSFHDPIPVMLLSAKLRKGFFYLASVEQFSGLLGRYFQKIGTYSVRRGQRDRASIKQTLTLLSQSDTHLVFFPEGGCSFQNDTVMPFRTGAIQLSFQAMQREMKQNGAVSDCYIVPLALKYQYIRNTEPIIRRLLNTLEQALKITPTLDLSVYQRLRAIAVEVMTNISQDYGLEPPNDAFPIDIDALRLQILAACESALGIEANQQMLVRERTYQIEAALATLTVKPAKLSPTLIRRSIFRLFNFNAIYDGYVAEQPTAERFLDTLTRLEREVFEIDRPKSKGVRVAQIGVGEVFNLKDYYDAYEADRSMTIDRLTLKAQSSVQSQIDSFGDDAKLLKF